MLKANQIPDYSRSSISAHRSTIYSLKSNSTSVRTDCVFCMHLIIVFRKLKVTH